MPSGMKRERIDRLLDWLWAPAGWVLSWLALSVYTSGDPPTALVFGTFLFLPLVAWFWRIRLKNAARGTREAADFMLGLSLFFSAILGIVASYFLARDLSEGIPGYVLIPLGLAVFWLGLWLLALRVRRLLVRVVLILLGCCFVVIGPLLALPLASELSHARMIGAAQQVTGWRFKWDGPEAKRP